MADAELTRLQADPADRPTLRAEPAAPGLRLEDTAPPAPDAALDEALLDGVAGSGRGLDIAPPPPVDTGRIIDL